MKTVVILAHECAPYHRPESTIGAQRPAQFAKWLGDFGWRPIVICCDRDQRRILSRLDIPSIKEGTKKRLQQASVDEAIIIPTPSLRDDGLIDRVWYTLASHRLSERPPRLSLRKAFTVAKFWSGDYSQSWQPCGRAAAEAVAQAARVDVCIGEHGPDAGLHLAQWFSRRFRVPWVADFRDPILMPFHGASRRIYAPIARRLVRTAAATINVTPSCTAIDRELFEIPAFTVRNGFDPDDFAVPSLRRHDERLVVVYTGQVFRPYQQLEVFLDGLRLLSSSVSQVASLVRFVYAGPSAECVTALAADRGILPLVRINERLPREDSLQLLQEADLALAIGTSSVLSAERLAHYCLPGKVYEYLGAGLPILCAPSDHGDLEALLRDAGGTVFANTPTEVRDVLSGLIDSRGLSTASYGMKISRRDRLDRFSRREGARRLAEILEAVVERRVSTLAVSV